MSPRFLQACQSLQSAEKACWDILLRELPDAEIFTAESLSTAMDQTLEQLWTLLRADPQEGTFRDVSTTLPPLPVAGECALTTHLPYFNAGERALELMGGEIAATEAKSAGPQPLREREELCAAFNVLVQCQLEAICNRCRLAGKCRYGDLRAVAGLSKRTRRGSKAGPMTPRGNTDEKGRSRPPARATRSQTRGGDPAV